MVEKTAQTAHLLFFYLTLQISALDQELIEVDPDTKEMLKMLVSVEHISLLFLVTVNKILLSTCRHID